MQKSTIAAGVHVKTHNLGSTEGMKGIIAPHLEARMEGVEGIVNGYPLGMGPEPDIWWVFHEEEKTIAAYRTCELLNIYKPMKEVQHPV